jgi:hypothetical protein
MVKRVLMCCAIAMLAITTNSCKKDISEVGKPSEPVKELSPDYQIARVWEYSGGEAPIMHMIFEPNGRLLFEGGFESWNPSAWTLDRKKRELTLKIRNIDDESLFVQNFHSEQKGSRMRVDKVARTIIFEIDETTRRLNFMNWYFYRKNEK